MIDTVGAPSGARRRVDVIFIAILAVALLLRLYLANTERFIHDEENNAIPLSETISFEPGRLHLPLRGENHGALPAYVVKASSTLFGTSQLGYRALHVILGLLAVVLVFRMTREWYGPVAARWAAALLAFNEYYLTVSSRATAHVPYHLLVVCAIYAFSRFLREERPRWLYAAGASVGLAFYSKEHAALLMPVFFVAVAAQAKYRRWLASPHAYLAATVFALAIAPDLYWNLTAKPQDAVVTYGDQAAAQAGYRNHLARIGGLGFSPYPAMFYARSTVKAVYRRVTGAEPRDETAEYFSMNAALGVLLLAAVLITTLRRRDGAMGTFLLLLFWGIFGFFTLIKRGNPPGRLDPVSWIWVEATMCPAVVLTGVRLADLAVGTWHRWRAAVWAFAAVVLLYACAWPVRALAMEGVEGAQDGVANVRHVLGLVAMMSVEQMNSHPLRTLIVALAIGLIVGFVAGWLARSSKKL